MKSGMLSIRARRILRSFSSIDLSVSRRRWLRRQSIGPLETDFRFLVRGDIAKKPHPAPDVCLLNSSAPWNVVRVSCILQLDFTMIVFIRMAVKFLNTLRKASGLTRRLRTDDINIRSSDPMKIIGQGILSG